MALMIGAKVAGVRKALGMTQEELAEKLKVSFSYPVDCVLLVLIICGGSWFASDISGRANPVNYFSGRSIDDIRCLCYNRPDC